MAYTERKTNFSFKETLPPFSRKTSEHTKNVGM